MTTYNKGDRVTYSGEFEVTRNSDDFSSVIFVRVKNGNTEFPVWRSDVTKVKPALPTAFGSAVEVDGVKHMFDRYWYSEAPANRTLSPSEMAKLDYTVLRDGI